LAKTIAFRVLGLTTKECGQ